MIKTGIGQDSHRIVETNKRPLILGGVIFQEKLSLAGNSDADVVLHALTNAVSGITCIPVLGPVADEMCQSGITDSRAYLKRALADLDAIGYRAVHASFSLECARPKILPKIAEMRQSIAEILKIELSNVAITATSGESLTEFGRGNGIQAFCVLTAAAQ
jgi:2-C-methyl-D-erythritol 2,4-cyclodiphosphate synthase